MFGGADGVPADDEARALWRKVTGLGGRADHRHLGHPGDNFWQMGETGPCGPCTEIHWFNGDATERSALRHVRRRSRPPDGLGWMEIWNLVFMQFERSLDSAGTARLASLPKPCVDTGAGLERVSSILQGVTSNYETDLLRPLVEKAAQISGKRYGASQGDDDVSMRVIADHARTTAFLIAEGVFPDRAGREYVLRRVMRRAIRHGHRLGIKEPFLHQVALEVVRGMGGAYPELERRKELIASVARGEEDRFRETIERGLKILEEEIASAGPAPAGAAKTVIRGETAFKLYDTFGFPLDLTEVIAHERGLAVDVEGYERALDEQRARSEGSKLNDEAAVAHVWHDVSEALAKVSRDGTVKFVGYDREDCDARVVALIKGGALVGQAAAGDEVIVVTEVTAFYGESGGQAGDTGLIEGRPGSLVLRVTDTRRPIAGVVAHSGQIEQGNVAVGDPVRLIVDHERRAATRRNHSATHLLHWALRTVLGEHATQKGSLVAADRLRFDFSHNRPLTNEELARIEDLVNAKVLTGAPVITEVLPIEEARKRGAMAIFEEKYGDVVRVLTMTSDSVELCGGTHARTLGEIGLFKIVAEQGLAAGVRRIEAATGLNALSYVRSVEGALRGAARVVKAPPAELAEKLEKLVDRERALEKEVADLKRQVAMGAGAAGVGVDDLLRGAREIPGGRALAVKLSVGDPSTLRETAERLRDRLGDSVVLVGAHNKDKAMLVLTVSKGLTGRYHAGELVKGVAQVVGGSGGGRPDMAQAGGTDVDQLDAALESLYARLA